MTDVESPSPAESLGGERDASEAVPAREGAGVRVMHWRLLASVLAIALVPAVGLTIAYWRATAASPEDEARREREALAALSRTAALAAERAETYFAGAETYVRGLPTLLEIKGMNPLRQRSLLLSEQSRHPEFAFFFTTDKDGKMLAVAPDPGEAELSAKAEFDLVAPTKSSGWSALSTHEGARVRRFAAAIVSVGTTGTYESGRLVFATTLAGVVCGALRLEPLSALVASAAGDGGLAVVDRLGETLASAGTLRASALEDPRLAPIAGAAKAGERAARRVRLSETEVVDAVAWPVAARDAAVVVWSPVWIPPGGGRRRTGPLLLLGGLSILIAGGLAYALARTIARPIEQLARAAAGDATLATVTGLPPEVAAVLRRLEGLQQRLRESNETLSRQGAELTELRDTQTSLELRVEDGVRAKEDLQALVALDAGDAKGAGPDLGARVSAWAAALADSFGWEHVFFLAHDAEAGRLADGLIHPPRPGALGSLSIPVAEGQSLLAVAALTGQAVVGSGDAIVHPTDQGLASSLTVRGLAAAPVRSKDRLIGVLGVAWRDRPPEGERALAERLGRVADRLAERLVRPAAVAAAGPSPMAGAELQQALQHIEAQLYDEPLELLNDPKRIHSVILRNMALKKLVVEMQDLTRLTEAGKPRTMEAAHVAKIAEMVFEAFRDELTFKQIHWKLDFADDLPEIWVDEPRIFYVFTTLLKVSVKATPRGGELVFSGRTGDGVITVRVRHTGAGFPSEAAERAMHTFHPDKDPVPEFAGAGLSLALSRAVVLAHGGSAHVQGEPGQSSEYVIELPIGPPEAD